MKKKITVFTVLVLLISSCKNELKEVKKFFDNSKIKSIEYIDVKGYRQGKKISFFENGKVYDIHYYKNDSLNGPNIIYFKNGKIKCKGEFKDNHLIDESMTFYENGSPKTKVLKDKNENDLMNYYYYDNFQLAEKRAFSADGQFIHAEKIYKSDGKLDMKESRFVQLKRLKNKLILKFVGGKEYKDSVFVNVIESFKSKKNKIDVYKTIRTVKFSNTRNLTLDIKESDFRNGLFNLYIETYHYDVNTPNVHNLDTYYVQFKKGDMAIMDNLNPIY